MRKTIEAVVRVPIPEWARYIAQDQEGQVWIFSQPPVLSKSDDDNTKMIWDMQSWDGESEPISEGIANLNFKKARFHIGENWKFENGILSLKD